MVNSMKLEIICYKNVKINAFTNPIYVDITPQNYAIQVARALKTSEDVKLLGSYTNLEMYYLGTFDDESGVLVPSEPDMLCNIKEVARCRLKELEENGKAA